MKLVFVNGWSAPAQLWDSVRQALPKNCEMEVIDLPPFTEKAHLFEVLDHRVDAHTLLMGWSLGAILAVDYLSHFRRPCAGLMTLAFNPCFVARSGWPCAMARAEFDEFYALVLKSNSAAIARRFGLLMTQGGRNARSDLRFLAQHYASRSLPHSEVLQVQLKWLGDSDLRNSAENLTKVPQKHLYGEADRLVPCQVAAQIAVWLGQPESSVCKIIPGMAHLPCGAFHEVIADHIMGFVAQLRVAA